MAGQICDQYVECQGAAAEDYPIYHHCRGLAFELTNCRARGRLEFRRRRLDAKLGPVPAQHAKHQGVAAEERVPRQAVAIVAEHRGDAHGPLGRRHVTRLAAPAFSEEAAVAPFLVVHLLRQ
jgi:hypothetical protein